MYKKQQKEGSKILMVTSSVSGEGKTFCSINLATVFALSDKKTVIDVKDGKGKIEIKK